MTAVLTRAETVTTVRPFTSDDYEGVVAVANTAYPEYPENAEQWRWQDANRDPKCKQARFVAERDGRVVAVGSYDQQGGMYHPRKFEVNITVHPDYRRQGIGAALYDAVIAALEPLDPIALHGEAREDHTEGIRFAEARGFVEAMREQESRLDLTTFDPAQYADEVRAVEAGGIALRTVGELMASDPDCKRRLFELQWAIHQDVPHPDETTRPEYDVWIKRFENPDFLPDGNIVAVDTTTGEYVGLSALWKSGDSPELHTGLTGILRSHRRRGIATALKVRAVTWAKENGYTANRTWNEVNNNGMLGINFRLGYVRQPAWLQLNRTIKEEQQNGDVA